jgi:hypothetical protein
VEDVAASTVRTKKALYFIGDAQREVRVAESVPDRYALRRIESKELLNQVQELPVDDVGWRYDILQKGECDALERDIYCYRPIKHE